MTTWYKVAKVGDIAPGSYKAVFAGDEEILLINLDEHYYAIEDKCTHQEAPLDGGELEGDQIICPLHGASFCVKTGEVTAPPAYEDVPTYPTKIENEAIFVGIEED